MKTIARITLGGLVGVTAFATASLALALGYRAPVVRTVSYGGAVKLSAQSPVSTRAQAIVLSRPCGFSQFTTLTVRMLGPRAEFSYSIAPALNTTYKVLIADREVVDMTVRVRPQLTVRRLTGNRYQVQVTTGNGKGLGGHSVLLERRSANGSWHTVGEANLKLVSRPDQVNAVASGSGRAPGKGPVRAVLTTGQAGSCFTSAASLPVAG